MQSHITDVFNMEELAQAVQTGFARAMWCGEPACEDLIKEKTGASARNMPKDAKPIAKMRLLRQTREDAYLFRKAILRNAVNATRQGRAAAPETRRQKRLWPIHTAFAACLPV
jgi:hypothetical protein